MQRMLAAASTRNSRPLIIYAAQSAVALELRRLFTEDDGIERILHQGLAWAGRSTRMHCKMMTKVVTVLMSMLLGATSGCVAIRNARQFESTRQNRGAMPAEFAQP